MSPELRLNIFMLTQCATVTLSCAFAMCIKVGAGASAAGSRGPGTARALCNCSAAARSMLLAALVLVPSAHSAILKPKTPIMGFRCAINLSISTHSDMI